MLVKGATGIFFQPGNRFPILYDVKSVKENSSHNLWNVCASMIYFMIGLMIVCKEGSINPAQIS